MSTRWCCGNVGWLGLRRVWEEVNNRISTLATSSVRTRDGPVVVCSRRERFGDALCGVFLLWRNTVLVNFGLGAEMVVAAGLLGL